MQERNILIGGIDISYRIAGQGEPFLILHGWGSSSEKWEKVADFLVKENFTVIVPDLPGFGKSKNMPEPWDLEDYSYFISKFIDALNLREFYLLGHSFGGSLAIMYSLNNYPKIKKLFLVGSSGIRKKSLKKIIFKNTAKIFKIFSFLPFYKEARKIFYKFVIRKSDYPYTDGVLKETFLRVIGEDISIFLPSVKAPTVIIWGEKDDVVSIKKAQIMQKSIKGSKLAVVPKGKHDLERQLPEVLSKKILEHI